MTSPVNDVFIGPWRHDAYNRPIYRVRAEDEVPELNEQTLAGGEVRDADGYRQIVFTNGAASTGNVSVTDEKVWVTDPTLSAVADPTGAADSSAAFKAAFARASTHLPVNSGHPVVSGPPGNYKLLENLYVPGHVGIHSDTSSGGMRLTFPNDTGAPTLASLGADAVSGATSVQYTGLVGSAFKAASALSPQTVHLSGNIFTYTGVTVSSATAGTLTGCSGFTGASGAGGANPPSIVQGYAMTFAGSDADYTVLNEGIHLVGPGVGNRTLWGFATQPNSLDAVFMHSWGRADCRVNGFRHAVSWTTDHQRVGRNFAAADCYSAIHVASPAQSFGNQLIDSGARLDGMFWSGIYIGKDNFMNVCTFGPQVKFGNEPWGVWKDGSPASRNGMITDSLIIEPTFEGMGLGLFGSADGLGLMSGVEMIMPNAGYNPTWMPPSATAPVGHFKCSLNNVAIRGRQTIFSLQLPATAEAAFVSDSLTHCIFESFDPTAVVASGRPICKPILQPSTIINNVRWEGDRWRGRLHGVVGATIPAGDIVGFRTPAAPYVTVEQAAISQQQVAGVAVAASQNAVVAAAHSGWVDVNVVAGVAGASVAAGGVKPVRLNGAAAGKAIAASSWADTSGHVFGATYGNGDDGTKVPINLTGLGG